MLTKKLKAREYRLKKIYGLTLQQYDELLDQQGGVCAICKRPPKPGKNLAVEHNHKSKEIRGLACFYCNRRLIGRHTDPDLLRRVADYIAQGTGLFVPDRKRPTRKRKR